MGYFIKRILILFFCFLTVFITAEARDYDVNSFGDIWRITYSHDGKYIATAELGGLIRIYDSVTLDILREFEGIVDATTMEFSPDNLYIALSPINEGGSADIFIYEIETGNIKFKLIHDNGGEIDSISYRFDGQRLVSATGGIIKIWDTTNGIEIMTLEAPRGGVNNVSYSPDGSKILLSYMQHVRILDANNETEIKVLHEQYTFFSEAYASYSQDGTKIVMCNWKGSFKEGERTITGGEIRIYDSDNYDLLYSYDIGNERMFRINASFIFNSNYVITTYSDRSNYDIAVIINYTDGNIVNTFNFDLPLRMAISPDGRTICYSDDKKNINILRID
jgi:WD40 repeat protein